MPVNYSGEAVRSEPARSVASAMWHGFWHRCPRCNGAGIFSSFLKTSPACPKCGLELYHHRADDFPPYVTIVIVGHIVVGLMLGLWKIWPMSDTVQYVLWPSLALAMSLALLPSIKGAVIGLQWALGMHGFGQVEDRDL